MGTTQPSLLSAPQLQLVDREDPTVYEWRSRTAEPSWLAVGIHGIVYLLGPIIGMLAMMIIGAVGVLIWRPLGGIFVGMIFLACILGGLLTGPFAQQKHGEHVSANLLWLGSCAYAVLILTALNPASNGFSIPLAEVEPEEAFAFWVENVLAVLLLDMPDVIGWSISDLEPVSNWARAEVVGLRVLIALGTLELVTGLVRRQFREQIFYGRVQDCLAQFEGLENDVIVTRVGAIVPDPAPVQVRAADLLNYLKSEKSVPP